MRQQTVNIYKFSELSEETQTAVIERLYDINTDYQWWDCTLDDFIAICGLMGIDTETKKVVSQSQKPVNPAVKVVIDDGKKTFERWLWAKFPSSPHEETELPLRMRFADFDLAGAKGNYILVVASGTTPWLLMSKKGEKRAERAVLGRPYPFADNEYSFNIEKIMDGAIVKTGWTNGSEKLLNPAVIAMIKQDSKNRQAVLELNKPIHYRIKSGMLVLLYRRTQASSM